MIDRLRSHPLARALRVDKLTIAALNATLQSYAEGLEASEIPLWRMLSVSEHELRERAERLATAAGPGATTVERTSMIGGGALPGEGMPSPCLAISPSLGAARGASFLRLWKTPILARVEDNTIILDLRSVTPDDDAEIGLALQALRKA